MTCISTFVFFDIETTGLPFQERNRTKITELCLLAVSRRDIEVLDAPYPVSKLTSVLNPGRKIHPKAEMLNGLTNECLKNAPTFAQKCNSIISFLKELPKPVCLVAHNGNKFDYKILLTECDYVKATLPEDLLCVDTLAGFRKFLNVHSKIQNLSKINADDNLTADEEMWPELNVSIEDWQDIDDICTSLTDISCEETKSNFDVSLVKQEHPHNNMNKNYITEELIEENKNQDIEQKRSAMIENIFGDSSKRSDKNTKRNNKRMNNVTKCNNKTNSNVKTNRNTVKKGEFTLSGLYERIFNKDFVNAHRAEGDCFALLECVAAMKDNFLPWLDSTCKKLTEITPLTPF